MSKIEHDPALVEKVTETLYIGLDGVKDHAIRVLDAVRAWDAEHAEPSIEALIAEIEADGWEFDGVIRDDDCTAWGAAAVRFWESNLPEDPGSDQIVRSRPALRAALLALRDAVKGERHD